MKELIGEKVQQIVGQFNANLSHEKCDTNLQKIAPYAIIKALKFNTI